MPVIPLRSVRRPRARGADGFSMIEVLVAMLILAFGLLGFALLQTMSLRFTQSANYRTEAVNLGYDILDQMRSNRFQAAAYAGAAGASFDEGEVDGSACNRPVGAVSIADNIARWQCQVVEALGDTAAAQVTLVNGLATVTVSWGDQRWDEDNPDASTSFTLSSRL